MKPSVAVALIIGGVILIAMPPVFVALLKVDLDQLAEAGQTYQSWCLGIGAAMIGIAACGSMFHREHK